MSTRKSTGEAIPRRALGRTGAEVSEPDLGGSHSGEIESKREAVRVVHEAIDSGITFVGFTGHKHPAIHLRMLSYDYSRK